MKGLIVRALGGFSMSLLITRGLTMGAAAIITAGGIMPWYRRRGRR